MSWLVWGGFLRTILVLHSTWLVNSATHVWGYRTHETRDDSTNLWWVAIVTYGEGWHNNHHALPDLGPARDRLVGGRHDLHRDPSSSPMVGLAHTIKMPKMPTAIRTPTGNRPAPLLAAMKGDETEFAGVGAN